MIQFDKQIIIDTLNTLGIENTGKPDRKGWLPVICPFHNDSSYGNAAINVKHSGFNCFACGHKTNLIGIVKHTKGISGKEAIQFLGLSDYNFYKEINDRKIISSENYNQKEKNKSKFIITYSELGLVEFDPQDYEYTRLRGFTKQFLKDFNIKLCVSGRYEGFMIIPIKDESLDIDLYEARKLYEHEKLKEYYKIRRASEDELRNRFKEERRENKYRLDFDKALCKHIVTDKNGRYHTDKDFVYLVMPKVRYPSAMDIDYTIFNREYLDTDKDLYIVEGIASLPKTMKVFGNNVTAVFGSNLSVEKLHILSKFKRIIVIPDGDLASIKMIQLLTSTLENILVIDKKRDDKDIHYEYDVKKSPLVDSMKYLVNKIVNIKEVDLK